MRAQFSKSLMTPALTTSAIGALVDYWFGTAKSLGRVSVPLPHPIIAC